MAVDQRVLGITVMMTFNGQGAMNQVNQSLTNTAQVAQKGSSAFGSMGRQTGFLSNQLYIMRRSMMYAISGLSIYKVYEAVSAWKSFRSELGSVNTTLQLTANQLTALGRAAINVSNATAQPLSEVLQSFQNIAQTYPTLNPANIPKFSLTEAVTANILGASPATVGSTVGALASSFYGRNKVLGKQGPQLINEIADMLVRLQKSGLPNVSGEDILSAAQNLTGGAIVGRFTLPEALSMYATFQRAFPSSSKASLYLRQLMTRIIRPTTAEAAYYTQAGLPSGAALSGLSGNQIVQQLLKAAISQPGSNMTYAQAQKAGFNNVVLGPAGTQLIQNAIGGRIQSGIAMSLLIRGFGQLAPEQKILQGALNPQSAQSDLEKRNQMYLAQNQMQLATTRLANLSTTLIDDMNPLIQTTGHLIAGVTGYLLGANKIMNEGSRHIDNLINRALPGRVGRDITSMGGGGIAEILGGTGILLAIRKMIGGSYSGALKSGLSHVPGLNKIFGRFLGGSAAGEAEQALGTIAKPYLTSAEVTSAFAGQANGTPQNPYWVVISPLSSAFFKNLGGGISSASSNLESAAKNLPKDVENALKGEVDHAPESAASEAEQIAKGAAETGGGIGAFSFFKSMLGKVFGKGAGDAEAGLEGAAEGAGGEVESIVPALSEILSAGPAEVGAGGGLASVPIDLFGAASTTLGAAAAGLGGVAASVVGALASSGSDPTSHSYANLEPILTSVLHSSNPDAAPSGFWQAEQAYAKAHGVGQNPFGNTLLQRYMEQWLQKRAIGPGGMDLSPQTFINSLSDQKDIENLYGKAVLQKMLAQVKSEGYERMKKQLKTKGGGSGPGSGVPTPISITSINRMLQGAQLAQQTKYIAAAASSAVTSMSGVLIPDQIDATFTLEPTQALEGMLKKQKVRTAIPVRFLNTNSPAPTSRGKNTTRGT